MTDLETKLVKLEKILSVVNESLTKDDFISAFEGVVSFLKKFEEKNKLETQKTKEELDKKFLESSKKIDEQTIAQTAAVKKELFRVISEKILGFVSDYDKKLKEIESLVGDIKQIDEKSFQDQTVERMLNDLEKKLPEFGISVRNSLEVLTGDERLDKSAIKGLEEALKDIETKASSRGGGNVYGPGKTKIIKVDLSDQLNGVLKTFALPSHFGILSVDSSSMPFGAFREGVDYNESGRNIVFTAAIDASIALAQGQSLIVKVLK